MDKACDTLFINKHLGGHTAEFEQFYFLAIQLEDGMIGVGQADKG